MSYKPRAPGTLKQATDSLIDAAGGQARAADLTGWPKQQFYRYSDDGEDNLNVTIPAGLIRQLETKVGDPILTRFLAAEQGYALLRLAEDPEGGMLAERAARIAAQVGRLFEDIAKALSPRGEGGAQVTGREAGVLMAELDGLLNLASALRSELMPIRDGGAK